MHPVNRLRHTLATNDENEPLPIIPKEWMQACLRAQHLQMESRKSKQQCTLAWQCRLAQKPNQRQQKSVRFGDVAKYNQQVQLEEKTAPSDKIGRDVSSKVILERYVLGLLSVKDNWITFDCGNPASLNAHLEKHGVSKEQLLEDLRRIYRYSNNNRVAILGYNNAWKLLPIISIKTFDFWSRTWVTLPGKKRLAPRLKSFMIKVAQDREMAATAIQACWRRHRAATLYQTTRSLLNKLNAFTLFRFVINHGCTISPHCCAALPHCSPTTPPRAPLFPLEGYR